MNRFYQNWIDSISSRFIDELPENIEKNSQFLEDQNDDLILIKT